MAIPLNSLEMGPMAAAAASRLGDLGLRGAPINYGAPMQGEAQGLLAQAQMEQQMRMFQAQQAMKFQQMSYQSQLDQQMQAQKDQADMQRHMLDKSVEQSIANRKDLTEQQKLAELTNYHEGQLGISQQQLQQTGQYQQGQQQIAQQGLQLQAMKTKFDEDLAQKKFGAGQFGALSAALVMGLNQAGDDPQKQQQVIQGIQQTAQQLGIPDEYLAPLSKMTPEQAKQYGQMGIFMAQTSNSGMGGGLGSMATSIFSSQPKEPLVEKSQQQMLDSQNLINQAQSMVDLIQKHPGMFTTMGNLSAAAGTQYGRSPLLQAAGQALSSVLPSALGKALSPQEAAQQDAAASTYDAAAKSLAATYAKNISPMLLRNASFINELVPTRGGFDASSAMLKLQTLISIMKQSQSLSQQYLNKGVSNYQNDPQYRSDLTQIVDSAKQQYDEATPFAKQYTYQGKPIDIAATLKNNPHLTLEKLLPQLQEAK